MVINYVTLQKVGETMAQQMRSVVKAKGGLLQKASVQLFLGVGSVYNYICLLYFSEVIWLYQTTPLTADCALLFL